MKDSAIVQLRIRYAYERFVEPQLPTDEADHVQRILKWRQWDRECEELVRKMAGDDMATAYKTVPWPIATVTDPNRVIAAGANLVNGIVVKAAWLEQFSVRLKIREDLRDLRS